MHKFVAFGLGCSVFAALGSAIASPDMVRQYNCTACHAEDKKKYGPTYQQVALRYADDSGAAERLAKKFSRVVLVFGAKRPCPHSLE